MNRILLSLIFSSLFLSAQSNPIGKWTIDIEWVDTIIESSIEGDPDSETNKMTAKMVRAQFADQSIVFKEDGTMVDPRGGDAQWKIKEDTKKFCLVDQFMIVILIYLKILQIKINLLQTMSIIVMIYIFQPKQKLLI